jgi:hypothetical protein
MQLRFAETWLACAIAVLVAGCSTPAAPPPLVAGASGADRVRIASIADRLVTANVELCAPRIGTVKRPGPIKGSVSREQCDVTFQVVPDAGVGAAADGSVILLSAGMLAFVRDDDELAVVMAHRLAHRLDDSRVRPPFATRLGDAVGLPLGPASEPVYDAAREAAADRMTLFLLARTDRDPAVAVRFWLRMASLPAGANDWLVRHAVSARRLDALTAIASEIAMLRAAEQPLEP